MGKQTRRALSLSRRGGAAPARRPCGRPPGCTWGPLRLLPPALPAVERPARGGQATHSPDTQHSGLTRTVQTRRPPPGPQTNLSPGPGGAPSKRPGCHNDRVSAGRPASLPASTGPRPSSRGKSSYCWVAALSKFTSELKTCPSLKPIHMLWEHHGTLRASGSSLLIPG